MTLDRIEVVPGIHMLRFKVGQAYLCEERDRVSLIDSGIAGVGERILSALDYLGRRPEDLRQVVITHYHEDHTGSLAWLAERTRARVFAHRLDAPVIRGEEPSAEPQITAEEQPFWAAKPEVPPAVPTHVHKELEDGDELDLFEGAIVLSVPGRTAGSIAVHVPGRRVLFTGDAAAAFKGNVIVGVFNVDPEGAREAFRKMAALDFDLACFGHGDPLVERASEDFRRAAMHVPVGNT